MPLTMKEILRGVDSKRVAQATKVEFDKYRTGTSRTTRLAKAIAQTYTAGQSSVKYATAITMLNNKGGVKLSCSCPDFIYTWERALHKKGSADIRYSTGDDPDTRNPSHTPGCCKHCVALYQKALADNIFTLT